MKKVIPCFYAGYGRYISRFRSIPYDIDCLKPVERRLLLALYDVAKKQVKSAKVIGHVIAQYHPHGDGSAYGTLQQLVQNGFAYGEGNWGRKGIEDAGAAAYRYTECRLEKWVLDLAFKYINYVPWENVEYNDEPLSLPCPLPLGLIGKDVSLGISFHRTLIPRYTMKDLATRLTWLLENGPVLHDLDQFKVDEITEKEFGPEIKPNFGNCQPREAEPKQFYKILLDGIGNIQGVPYGRVGNVKVKKKNLACIEVLGRCPNNSFKALVNACTKDASKKKKIPFNVVDSSKEEINVRLFPDKKKEDLTKWAPIIWDKYLIKNLGINVLVCDEEENIKNVGIDDILLMNYRYWRTAVFRYRQEGFDKAVKKLFQNNVVQIIKDIYDNNVCKTVQDIVDIYIKSLNTDTSGKPIYTQIQLESFDAENNVYSNYHCPITEQDIEKICSSNTIKRLIERTIDLTKIQQEIADCKQHIADTDIDCFNIVKSYC